MPQKKSLKDKLKSQKFAVFVFYTLVQTFILLQFKDYPSWTWPLTVAVISPGIVAVMFYAARAVQYLANALQGIKGNVPSPPQVGIFNAEEDGDE